jgi:hypothetical protein
MSLSDRERREFAQIELNLKEIEKRSKPLVSNNLPQWKWHVIIAVLFVAGLMTGIDNGVLACLSAFFIFGPIGKVKTRDNLER